MALFMEQLDTTIVNTAVPSMALSLGVEPLSLKSIVASYILSLAVAIPVSGWIADKFGTRRVFATAVIIFTFASMLCGLSVNVPMLVTARLLQGFGAAMMMPVGRSAIIRTFPKAELMNAMNFVIIPALIAPLLGPTVGGLMVHFVSWRYIFFINLPIGLIALYFILRYMPDYYGEKDRPLDKIGLLLFSSGIAIISWILEIFGEHHISTTFALSYFALGCALLAAYVWHMRFTAYPLLKLSLLHIRTFRVSVLGGFITRIGIGGMPFLLPLFYQVGLQLPAWQSGMLMMPTAIAAMAMKLLSRPILKYMGYRRVLIVNTVLMGFTIMCFSLIKSAQHIVWIVLLALTQGFFTSMQMTSNNSMGYADIAPIDASMASTIASSFQQISMSFGLACGSLLAGWLLNGIPQSNADMVITALHKVFIILGIVTIVSSVTFHTLKPDDGKAMSG